MRVSHSQAFQLSYGHFLITVAHLQLIPVAIDFGHRGEDPSHPIHRCFPGPQLCCSHRWPLRDACDPPPAYTGLTTGETPAGA